MNFAVLNSALNPVAWKFEIKRLDVTLIPINYGAVNIGDEMEQMSV
jgi:hypothetical protein